MDKLITVYIENINTGGQSGFEFFEDEREASNHLKRVKQDIKKHSKELEFKAVKRLASYDRRNNRVSL